MKVTATCNGVTINIEGSPHDCSSFLDIFWGDGHMCGTSCYAFGCEYRGTVLLDELKELQDKIRKAKERAASQKRMVNDIERSKAILGKEPCCHLSACGVLCFCDQKKCDPFARHYGNCGAADCPILK